MAPAKINLTLDITGLLPGGYHALETVMQSVSLRDTVTVEAVPGKGIAVTCTVADGAATIPLDNSNTAAKAAIAFFEYTGIPPLGLAIHIEKAIPVQAGLGGGSADAAATLVALNHMLDARLTVAELMEIGLAVGSDVPFCVAGGTKLARGRGELLTGLPALLECVIVIAKPQRGVSTVNAFNRYDEYSGELPRPDTAAMLRAIEGGDLAGIGAHMRNVFEAVTGSGEVEAIKAAMLSAGALGAAMSGSGSAVAGLFAGEAAAIVYASQLKQSYDSVWLARPLAHGAKKVI
jgi:4-diphosphocytidyl-2-C-methyl-D-erythritol kinase